MTNKELEGCISYHKELLRDSRIFMSPSVSYLEEETIKYLEELKVIKEREG